MLSIIALATIAFATTNVDDLFVLLAFLARGRPSAGEVVAGQYLGIAALTAAAIICSLAALAIPSAYLGLLGLLPVAIGLNHLLSRAPGDDGADDEAGAAAGTLSVAAVTIANGGDNIAVYVPLIAGRGAGEIALFVATFAVMTGLWLLIARAMLLHPKLGALIRRWGDQLFPWVLIALGCAILYEGRAIDLLA